jgi:nitrate reductase cytochrome c-type subunit
VTRINIILVFFISFLIIPGIGETLEEKSDLEKKSRIDLSRVYEGAPPLIPHDIEDYRITRS